jgi:hypothetical protein
LGRTESPRETPLTDLQHPKMGRSLSDPDWPVLKSRGRGRDQNLVSSHKLLFIAERIWTQMALLTTSKFTTSIASLPGAPSRGSCLCCSVRFCIYKAKSLRSEVTKFQVTEAASCLVTECKNWAMFLLRRKIEIPYRLLYNELTNFLLPYSKWTAVI